MGVSDALQEFVVSTVNAAVSVALDEGKEVAVQSRNGVLPGTCVNYKRYIFSTPTDDLPAPPTDISQYPLFHNPGPAGAESPGTQVIAEHYCSLFDRECSARPGDATSPECWRNVFARTVKEEVCNHEQILRMKRLQMGLVELQNMIDEAKKYK